MYCLGLEARESTQVLATSTLTAMMHPNLADIVASMFCKPFEVVPAAPIFDTQDSWKMCFVDGH